MTTLRLGEQHSEALDSACPQTIALALDIPGAFGAGIALLDSKNVLRMAYARRRDGEASRFPQFALERGSVTFQAVQRNEALLITDCARQAPQSPAYRIAGLASLIAAPVSMHGEVIGALVVTAAQPGAFAGDRVPHVAALARALGLELANSHIERRHTHLQHLYAGLRASNRLLIGSTRTVDQLYAAACDICIRHAGFDFAWVARPDEDGWFGTLASAGPARGLIDDIRVSSRADQSEEEGVMGWVWRNGRPAYRQAPPSGQPHGAWDAALAAHGINGFAAVPLRLNKRIDAVLAVGVREAHFFGDQERLLYEEIGIDLSEALRLLDARVRTQLAAKAVQHAPTGIMIADPRTQRVLYSNSAMARLTGLSSRDLRGRTGLFFMPGDPTGRTLPRFNASIRAGRLWRGMVWGRGAKRVWEASAEVRTIAGPDRGKRLLAIFGPRPELPDENVRDNLTGLPNAVGLLHSLQRRIDVAAERGLVLIRINIHDLVSVSSAYGPAGSDRVLVELAARLRQALPMSTIVGRIEADKFAVISRHLRRDGLARAAQVLLRKVDQTVIAPFAIDDEQIPLRLARSIALYPGDADEARALLARAEANLGPATEARARPGQQALRDPEAIRNRLATAARLKRVLHGDNGIHPWYQPKICLRTGAMVSAEALARWHDGSRGWISPGEFLPLTDALGLTTQLNRKILDRVLADLARWREAEGGAWPIAINLSAEQLTDEALPSELLRALQAHALPASLLHVEITEHDVIAHVGTARRILQRLVEAGIAVSLDDFGTGYSSLSMLRDLPLSRLKLDKSFVDRLPGDRRSLNVAAMIIDLAHELAMAVIAEGIESQAQAEALEALGCDYGQGFFFARPMPEQAFRENWLGGTFDLADERG